MTELYRPACLRANYTPVSKRPKKYVSSERARQIVSHSLDMLKKFNNDYHDRDLDKEEYLAVYRYISTSSVWTGITDDIGDYNDVESFVNSNNTLRISFMCGAIIRTTLTKD